jgi:hypothetical protein
MKSNSQFRIGVRNRFKSLPDGRRVFLSNFPWTGYYVIPDSSTERQLFRKTSWELLFIFFSIFVVFGVLFWFFRSVVGHYISGVIPLLSFVFAAIIRWALYRQDLRNLQKIDYESTVSSFYNELSKNLRSHSKNSLPNYEISTLLDIPNSSDKTIMLKYTESFRIFCVVGQLVRLFGKQNYQQRMMFTQILNGKTKCYMPSVDLASRLCLMKAQVKLL